MATAAQAREILKSLDEKVDELRQAVEAFTEAGKHKTNSDKELETAASKSEVGKE